MHRGPFDCDRNLTSGDNEKYAPSRAASWEAHALEQAQDEYQSKEQILMLGIQAKGLGGLEKNEPSHPYYQSGYPLEHTVLETSPGNNIMMKNTVSKPSFLCSNDDIRARTMPNPYWSESSGLQLAPIAADLTGQTSSSILHSATNKINCASSAPVSWIPARECPVTSMQDSLISNLQAMNFLSGSASQKVHPHCKWPASGCSELELMKLTSTSEAKGTSVYSEGTSTCDAGAIIGFDEFSAIPDKGIGVSIYEQKLHSGNRQDFVLKTMEHSSDNKLVKDIVQHIDTWVDTGVNLRRDTNSDETYVDSREHRFKSDISTMNPGLVEDLANPQNLADCVDSTNRGIDRSNVFNSWLPPSSSDSRVPVNDLKGFEVHTNNCGYSTTQTVSETPHLLKLNQPASSISKSVIYPPPRFPPGFPPRHTSGEGQSCFRPSSSGNPQFKLSGKQSHVNSSQKISSSNSYFSMEPIDGIKMASSRALLQPATLLTSPDYRSNLIGLDGSEQRVQHQLSVGSAHENSTEVDQNKTQLTQMALHGMKTYIGSREASATGSPTEMDSRVIGRRGQTGLTNTTNSRASVLHHQFLRPVSQRNGPEVQATDFNPLYYSQAR